ncbi:MAG: alpha-E domain-containing protein [Candidatus Synoicihabitans palmerolidicus]|nr:alpha-E domain-containing protein [Candidatus Synoicihabitans palmerolidicus]
MLRSCSAFEAFRRTKRGRLSLERVVDYLLRNSDFSRTVLASVIYAENCLSKLIQDLFVTRAKPVTEKLTALHTHLEQQPIEAIIGAGLHEYLDDIQVRLSEVHAAVLATFIEYTPAVANA